MDWNKAAERLGNHALESCPRWLIFVQGVGQKPGAKPRMDEAITTDEFFPGENLKGAVDAPINLKTPSKLVYAPHVFGPGSATLEYFNDRKYPNNLEDVWHRHFGFLPRETGQPVIIGELAIPRARIYCERASTHYAMHALSIRAHVVSMTPQAHGAGG